MKNEAKDYRDPKFYAAFAKNLTPIFREIHKERFMQDGKWGGPEHDDTHNSHDWIAYITKHTGMGVRWPWNPGAFREQMVNVAALAVAAIQWCDRLEARTKDRNSQ